MKNFFNTTSISQFTQLLYKQQAKHHFLIISYETEFSNIRQCSNMLDAILQDFETYRQRIVALEVCSL